MYYSKSHEVPHDKAVKTIREAMNAQNISFLDLVERIGYSFRHKGLEDLDLFFSGMHKNERQLRLKIGEALSIDHELLHGERGFEKYEDCCRFDFQPYLVRIPSNTRPSQITIFGFVGYEFTFIVGRYKELLHMPFEEQMKFIKKKIERDNNKHNDFVPFFGEKLGYAFHSDYERLPVPLSLDGSVLKDIEITYNGQFSCNVSVSSRVISETAHFVIPRLTPQVLG